MRWDAMLCFFSLAMLVMIALAETGALDRIQGHYILWREGLGPYDRRLHPIIDACGDGPICRVTPTPPPSPPAD